MPDRAKMVARLIRPRLVLNIGVEVGTWTGSTSMYLLKHFPTLRLICVDPYRVQQDDAAQICVCKTQEQYDALYNSLVQKFSKLFGNRTIWIRKTSAEASKEIKDKSLDFVFIDGNHAYEFVKQDIVLWAPKVRCGGIICGHDIQREGVQKAVEEVLGKYKQIGRKCWYKTNR